LLQIDAFALIGVAHTPRRESERLHRDGNKIHLIKTREQSILLLLASKSVQRIYFWTKRARAELRKTFLHQDIHENVDNFFATLEIGLPGKL
jgi:hypothetical protein